MATRRLDVEIRSNAGRFAAGMANAARSTQRLGLSATVASRDLDRLDRRMRSIGSAANLARGALAGFLTAATVRRVGQFATSLIDASASLVAQAEALGIASDELQVFQRVLEGQGATTEQINQGLSQLTRNIGLAAQGTGTAGEVFTRLGISIRNADGSIRGSLDVYRDLVGALENVGPAARAAALGLTIGEEAARSFGTNVALGLAELDVALSRERGLGVATDEQNDTLEALRVTLGQIRNAIETFGTVVLANLGIQLQEIATTVRDGVVALIQLEQTTQVVSRAILEVIERIRQWYRVLSIATRIFLAFTVVRRVLGAFNAFASGLRSSAGATRALLPLWRALRERLVGFLTTLPVVGVVFRLLDNLADAVADVFAPLGDVLDRMRTINIEAIRLGSAMEQLSETFAEVGRRAPDIAAQYEEAFAGIRRRVELLDAFATPALIRRPGLTDGAVEFTRAQLDAMRRTIAQEAQRSESCASRGVVPDHRRGRGRGGGTPIWRNPSRARHAPGGSADTNPVQRRA